VVALSWRLFDRITSFDAATALGRRSDAELPS
jgi:hypothetical protein